jgi:hypothetical protein
MAAITRSDRPAAAGHHADAQRGGAAARARGKYSREISELSAAWPRQADPAAFDGTGTNADAYAGAITALGQLAAMPEEVFIALEVFAT